MKGRASGRRDGRVTEIQLQLALLPVGMREGWGQERKINEVMEWKWTDIDEMREIYGLARKHKI